MTIQGAEFPPFPPSGPSDWVGLVLIVAFGGMALAYMAKWFFRSPVAAAWAERIKERGKRRRHWKGIGGEWLDEPAEAEPGRVAALEEEVTRLRGELTELAERLDFAERMLAERRERRLGAGS